MNWNDRKQIIKKSIERMIDIKYLTVNPLITIDGGIAAGIANDLSTFEDTEEKNKEITIMMDTLKRYFPEQFQQLVDSLKKKEGETKDNGEKRKDYR